MLEPANTTDAYTNADLRADVALARQSRVRFAFEFPGLLQAFTDADATANRARDRNRRHGITGIALVLIALLYASSAPLRHDMDPSLAAALGYFAATLGLIGTALGLAGLRRNSQRRIWLTSRLRTETLRLFHFYYVAANLPEIEVAAGDAAARERYLAARSAALDKMMQRELGDPGAALDAAVRAPSNTPFVAIAEQPAAGNNVSATAGELFATWRSIRLDWQLRYCEAKLSHHRTGRKLSPLQQEHAFSMLGWGCIGLVVLLHVAHFAEAFAHIPAEWLEVAVIWIALIALAARALEDGLKPQREVERYEQYRASITVARERFEIATTMPAKLEVMRAFEHASLEEMRVFLRSHAAARFLL